MNRAAARSYPFQVIRKFMFNRPGEVFILVEMISFRRRCQRNGRLK